MENEIRNKARVSEGYDAEQIIYLAMEVKKKRMLSAAYVMEKLGCHRISNMFKNKQIKEPDRSWVNRFLEYIDSRLGYPTYIDNQRFLICTPEHVGSFYDKFGEIIKNTPPELLFTADETMLQANFLKKKAFPNDIGKYIEREPDGIPHMTCMCCSNLVGTPCPLYIIIKNRVRMPEELEGLQHGNLFQIGSTPSGWMSRFTFFYWVIHFIAFVTRYKEDLGRSFGPIAPVLITDGHISRSCPIALELLHAYNIRLITLPGHSTHILQVFDVSLASPLKNFFSHLIVDYLRTTHRRVYNNDEATLRRCAFEAIVNAWSRACTFENCQRGAEKVGLYPYNPERATSNEYVRNLTPAEQENIARRRTVNRELDVNNKDLTRLHEYTAIRNYMLQHDGERVLCKRICDFHSYPELFKEIFDAGRKVRSVQITRPRAISCCYFYEMYPDW